MVADKAKSGKSGVTLAIILIVVYAIVFVGTLVYTGVIGGSDDKKTNATNKKVDKEGNEQSVAGDIAKETGITKKTEKSSESTTSSTSSTSSTTTSTTVANGTSTSLPAQQSAGDKLKKLVKMYENMDSEQAAEIMTKLSNNEAVTLLSEINEEQAAEILAAMDTSRAALLSEKLGLQQQ